MNIVKKLMISAFIVICISWTEEKADSVDKQIGSVPSSVKNESDILSVGVVDENVPVLLVREEREGYISTITDYFVIYGEERIGPFDSVKYFDFFNTEKIVTYKARIDGKDYCLRGCN